MVQTHGNDEAERRVIDDVRRVGWHIIGIEGDSEGPAFAFSVGLYHTFEQPEIIVVGLKMEIMATVINGIGYQMKSGHCFEDWHESDQVLEGYPCIFRRVTRDLYPDYLGFAMWFYEYKYFPVLQCVWPDKSLHFPWHPEFSESLKELQPVLSREPVWRFHDGNDRAVITTRQVLEDGQPILMVTHDKDDDWQFMCGTTNRTEDGRVVSTGVSDRA